MVDSTNSWWIDSKVNDHIYNSLQGFQLSRRLNNEDTYLTLTSNASTIVKLVEDVTIVLENKYLLKLKDCLFVPRSKRNLILVFSLNKWNHLVYLNKEVIIRKNNLFICLGTLVDNLYHKPLLLFYFVLRIIKFH